MQNYGEQYRKILFNRLKDAMDEELQGNNVNNNVSLEDQTILIFEDLCNILCKAHSFKENENKVWDEK